jgi:hypothetical protein
MEHLGELPYAIDWSWARILAAAVAMVAATLLSVPLAIIYLRTKPAHEFDTAVPRSILTLAATIAGILVVVQGSIARALSLAGVVGAVRFRSSLHDSNDAVYLLGTIAIGLATGSQAVDVGIVISVVISLTLLFLWRLRLDAIKEALLSQERQPHHGHHRPPDDKAAHEAQPAAPPAGELFRTLGASVVFPLAATRPPRLRYLVVETAHAERARPLVETFLERETKRWQLDGSSGNGESHGHAHPSARVTLLYLVRFRKHSHPNAIFERLEALGRQSEFTVHLETAGSHAEPAA